MRLVKKIFTSIWNEFIYGGHLLSFGAVSIVFTSAILLGIKITWDCLLVVYLGCQIIYLYNRYREFEKDILTNPERTRHIEKYIKYTPLIILFFLLIIVGLLLYLNKTIVLLFSLILLFLGLLYTTVFKGLTKKTPAFKSFFVSLMWALLAIFLILYYSFPLNLAVIFIFIFIFLRWFVNTGFFDIKDIESDKKEGLLTLPIMLGKKKLLYLLGLISFFAIVPLVYGFYFKLFPAYSLMLLFTVPYTFYYFKELNDGKVNTSFLYTVIVDGEFILWTVFILIGKFLL